MQNFALLLNVDKSKIKSVNVVRATGQVGRTAGDVTVILVLANDPVESVADTSAISEQNDALDQLSATITNQIMTGQLQEAAAQTLNIVFSTLTVAKPSLTGESKSQPIKQLSKLVVIKSASKCRAQSPCEVQPLLLAVDQDVL